MKKGESFEGLIAWIHTCLADKAKIVPNDVIKDKDTGELRQIDIAIYVTDGPYTMLAIIEVRDHNRRVGSPYIEEISSKRISVGADAAVIVSRSGFTKPAVEKAARQNIRIMTYDEALQYQWPHWAMMKTVTVINRNFEIKHVDFKFSSELDEVSAKDFNAMSNLPLRPDNVKFQVAEETGQLDINSLVNQFLDKNPFIWEGIKHNESPVRRIISIKLSNKPPMRFIAGGSLISVQRLNVVLSLKIIEEERPLIYSALRSKKGEASVSDILSAIVPFGSEMAKLELMAKGGSEAIEAGQKLFFRVTKS